MSHHQRLCNASVAAGHLQTRLNSTLMVYALIAPRPWNADMKSVARRAGAELAPTKQARFFTPVCWMRTVPRNGAPFAERNLVAARLDGHRINQPTAESPANVAKNGWLTHVARDSLTAARELNR